MLTTIFFLDKKEVDDATINKPDTRHILCQFCVSFVRPFWSLKATQLRLHLMLI